MLPPCMVMREHRTASVSVHVPHGDPVTVWIELETGGARDQLRQLENWTPAAPDRRRLGGRGFIRDSG
jgi:4-alpha-glucanotransferase